MEVEEVLIEISASSYPDTVAAEKRQVVLWQRRLLISQGSRVCLTSITCVSVFSRPGSEEVSQHSHRCDLPI